MRIRDIYERYEIPEVVQRAALEKAAYISHLRAQWVGPTFDWSVLTKAMLFGNLGDVETTKLVRKKVGLDKFIVSVIDRGVIERAGEILLSHDLYLMTYLYCQIMSSKDLNEEEAATRMSLENFLSENLLVPITEVEKNASKKECDRFLDLEILHYKNPSV